MLIAKIGHHHEKNRGSFQLLFGLKIYHSPPRYLDQKKVNLHSHPLSHRLVNSSLLSCYIKLPYLLLGVQTRVSGTVFID